MRPTASEAATATEAAGVVIPARSTPDRRMVFSLMPAASLRELGIGGGLIVLYLAVTRIGHLHAAKLGVQIGPVPLFLTEIFMIATVLVVAITRPAQIVCWLTTGGLTRAPGMLLWLLFLTSLVYAI